VHACHCLGTCPRFMALKRMARGIHAWHPNKRYYPGLSGQRCIQSTEVRRPQIVHPGTGLHFDVFLCELSLCSIRSTTSNRAVNTGRDDRKRWFPLNHHHQISEKTYHTFFLCEDNPPRNFTSKSVGGK
jgi:hypothetical protein